MTSLHLVRRLASAGLTLLCHIGSWTSASTPAQISFQPRPDSYFALLPCSRAAPQPPLPHHLALLYVTSYAHLRVSFACASPLFRQHQAEHDLLSLSALSSLPHLSPSPSPSLVASDASMFPSPVSPLAFRSVSFASASSTTQERAPRYIAAARGS